MLIKRTKPGRAPYWTTPGGGIEDDDQSPEAAPHRELAEEPGAEASVVSPVFYRQELRRCPGGDRALDNNGVTL